MEINGFAVLAARVDGSWECSLLDDEVLEDLSAVLTALRNQGAEGAAVFALIEVDEQFFALVRPMPGGARLLLSDSAAALDYDLAADIVELLDVDTPDEDDIDDGPWPEGDPGILADFGVSEQEMQVIIDDEELYPDEQLQLIADRCGFGDEFADLVGDDD